MKIRLSFAVAIAVIFALAACQKKEIAPKHVFFIVIDTLRADHLGCYGYTISTSPFIDKLAEEGVLFKNAYATANNTLESVFSFLSSATNVNNAVYDNGFINAYSSLQKCLKDEGYTTIAIVSNPWLKSRKDIFQDGFTHFEFVISDSWEQHGIFNTTELVTKTTLDFLDTKFNPDEKNFFYIHYLDPHDPYASPVNYGFFSGKVPPYPVYVSTHSGVSVVRQRYKEDPAFTGIPNPKSISENDLNYLISKYDSEIRFVDSHIEQLLTTLQEMGILEESLIIITSDHGEEFLEHGCLKHGFQLYDESIHIPLIFYWKDHLKATRKKNLVSGIDIAPTILEFCRANKPPGMLGSTIFAGDRKEPVLFCTHFVNQKQRGMRSDAWKLIENLRTGEIKIFDLKNDPGEQKDLFDNDARKWGHLFKTYEKLLSKHEVRKVEKEEKSLEIDTETRKQLEALGYL